LMQDNYEITIWDFQVITHITQGASQEIDSLFFSL
jgi:hypothetical protein